MNFPLLLVLSVISAMVIFVMAGTGVEHPHDDPTVRCSYASKRKMLKESCEHFRRRKRSERSSPEGQKEESHGEIMIIANNTSGSILLRNKRGKLYYCCVPNQKNCKRIRVCLE